MDIATKLKAGLIFQAHEYLNFRRHMVSTKQQQKNKVEISVKVQVITNMFWGSLPPKFKKMFFNTFGTIIITKLVYKYLEKLEQVT